MLKMKTKRHGFFLAAGKTLCERAANFSTTPSLGAPTLLI